MNSVRALLSWPIVGWMCFVFLGSLPYKFSGHPDTQHIFGTIGDWIGGFFGTGIGSLFRDVGPYLVGGFELLTSLILLAPLPLWLLWKARSGKRPDGDRTPGTNGQGGGGTRFGDTRRRLHALGGLMGSAVMSGAVFFHLVSPLGVEVLHEGESDGGSLFYAAVSILVLGVVLFALNAGRSREPDPY